MAKQGMSRPEWTHTQPRNDVPPVPELQGKAKRRKKKAPPIIAGTSGPELKVYHATPPQPDREVPPCGTSGPRLASGEPADEDERSVP